MKKFVIILSIAQLVFLSFSFSQKPKKYNTAEIQLKLQKLKVLGNVLYVAAHPDDENTRLITYLANENKVNAGYFSFTRGDGGQNLIGPEIRDELGVIRTQELLAARRIDNGQQFFSRAVDFGYSKNPGETFNIWDREKVLGDLVWVIRSFKPEIIITRFNTVTGGNHGHHTASAILAEEAFKLAGDKTKYKDQLKYVKPWQPTSLYWNTYWWRKSEYQKDTSELISIDVGKFNTLLGLSYTEIAALSRSSHKSQGFGATGSRGEQMEYLQYELGTKAEKDVFEVVDISWNKILDGKEIDDQIDKLLEKYNPNKPEAILSNLIALKKSIEKIGDDFWKQKKLSEIDEIVYAVTGLYLEAKAEDFTACPGEEVAIKIEAVNRSTSNIILKEIKFIDFNKVSDYAMSLKNNDLQNIQLNIEIPDNNSYSQPYWLVKDHDIGTFKVGDQLMIGKGENDATISCEFSLLIEDEEFVFTRPVIYKRNDPVRGEVYRPFVIAPPVLANIGGSVVIFANHTSQEISVNIRAGKDQLEGTLMLDLPESWSVEPESYKFELSQKDENKLFIFKITPPDKQETATARAIVTLGTDQYNYSLEEINYNHFPAQMLFNSSDVKFVKLDLEKGNEKVGYITGAGDNIPKNLRQIGYEVNIINDLEFSGDILDQYDVIILGVRALNTVKRLKFDIDKLLEFVKRGGNLIIQYNTSHRLVTENFAPYPLQLSRDRITEEASKVKILNPDHQVLNYPNKINENDFDDWVQERGLYFPGNWSDEYETIISAHDPGEKPLEGGLLIAKYGKGHYIYSGYSWFRELPAGVPGAYRLFVNMISMGKGEK